MAVAQKLRSSNTVTANLGTFLSIAALSAGKPALVQHKPLKKVDIVVAIPVLNVTYSRSSRASIPEAEPCNS
jgi:hypothetical protein